MFHKAWMKKLNLILVLSIVNYSKCCIVPCKLSQKGTVWGYWYLYQEFPTAAKFESRYNFQNHYKMNSYNFFLFINSKKNEKDNHQETWRDISGTFISLSNSLLPMMMSFKEHLIKPKFHSMNKTLFWFLQYIS